MLRLKAIVTRLRASFTRIKIFSAAWRVYTIHPYLRISRIHLHAVTLLLVIDAILGLAIPWQTGGIVDGMFSRSGASVLSHSLAMGVLELASVALSVVLYRVRNRLSSRASKNLAMAAFEGVQNLPYRRVVQMSTGEIINRIVGDSDAVAGGLLYVESTIITSCGTLGIAAVWMLIVSWPLALISLAFIPIWFLIISQPGTPNEKRLRALRLSLATCTDRANTIIAERLSSIGVARAHAHRAFAFDKKAFDAAATALSEARVRVNNRMALVNAELAALASFAAPLSVLAIGAVIVLHGKLSAGTVVAFLAVQTRLFTPMNGLGALQVQLAGLRGIADRLLSILEGTAAFVEEPRPRGRYKATYDDQLAIKADDLVLQHDNTPLTRPINFTVKTGSVLVIVGPTGIGKTTLLHTLLGLIEPASGTVKLFEMEPITALRCGVRLGYVSQSESVVSDSVAHNVWYGREDLDYDELRRSLGIAELMDRVDRLPSGIDHEVRAAGGMLSGGEKQRIAMARAVYRSPDLIFIDEGTSALDVQTADSVIQGLRRELPHATLVIVTHRTGLTAIADQVLTFSAEGLEVSCLSTTI
jgi:ATP-binding cassette subfamily B protein